MAIFHLTHSFVRRSNGSSSVATTAYNAGQKLEDGAGSCAYSDYTRKGGILYDEITLPSGSPAWANNRGELWRRLEAREDRSSIDERSLRAQGLSRKPTKHHGKRSKVRRNRLDSIRPIQPKSPIVRTTKHNSPDGSVTIQKVITHSALNKIEVGNKSTAPSLNPTSRKGWPAEAVAAWNAWGSKNPHLFFRIWSELAPDGFTLGGGPSL